MKFLKYCLLIFIIFLTSSCVNNSVYIGVNSSYNGHYRSKNTILNRDNYLFIRVSGGGLTIYFGDESESNIQGLDYESVNPYNITGYSDDTYDFKTANMIGTVTFNGITVATIKLSKFTPPTFELENMVLEKINSY